MKKIEQGTVLTIGVLIITVVISHVRLGGKLDTFAAVNQVEHEYFKQELGEIKTGTFPVEFYDVVSLPSITKTDLPDPAPKPRKKIYAVTEE